MDPKREADSSLESDRQKRTRLLFQEAPAMVQADPSGQAVMNPQFLRWVEQRPEVQGMETFFPESPIDRMTEVSLPEPMRETVHKVAQDIEDHLRTAVSLRICPLGRPEILVRPLNLRREYQVVMSREEHAALNGKYTSLAAIRRRVAQLSMEHFGVMQTFVPHVRADLAEKGWVVYVCPRCNSHADERNLFPMDRHPFDDMICQACKVRFHGSPWRDVCVPDLDANCRHASLYVSSGGSLSLCHDIGFVVVTDRSME